MFNAPAPTLQFYRLPRRCLYGTEWELNFWDAVYYLAERDGGVFQVTASEMAMLMSGQAMRPACETARYLSACARRPWRAGPWWT